MGWLGFRLCLFFQWVVGCVPDLFDSIAFRSETRPSVIDSNDSHSSSDREWPVRGCNACRQMFMMSFDFCSELVDVEF